MFPSSFPSSVPCPGLPFPPRSPVGPVPPLPRYYERLRLPAAPSARASVSLRPSVPAPLRSFALARAERRHCASHGRLRVARPSSLEAAGSPRFLEVPLHVRHALRPRPDLGASHRGASVLRSPQLTTPAPTRIRFEAQLRGIALPVYASQPGSPPRHATLGSGRSLAFAGQDSSCWDPLKVSVTT